MHQATGGVIHEDQKTTLWRSAFEPVMVRAIDLNQFSEAVATITRLINPGSPTGMRTPEAVGCHPVTDGFNGEINMMAFGQFFCCERRTKVRIVTPNQIQGFTADLFIDPIIRCAVKPRPSGRGL